MIDYETLFLLGVAFGVVTLSVLKWKLEDYVKKSEESEEEDER